MHPGIWRRATTVFRRAVAEGEAERPDEEAPAAARTRARRVVTRKLAEAVAEQRLLWHLRGQTTIRLVHPDDLSPADARAASRRLLLADRDKHWRWGVVDGLLVLAAAPVALLPGPNLLAYYFIFRTVGHVLSLRGASHGLSHAAWTPVASAPLTALRAALTLDPEGRAARVGEIAGTLGLARLAPFVLRVADRPA